MRLLWPLRGLAMTGYAMTDANVHNNGETGGKMAILNIKIKLSSTLRHTFLAIFRGVLLGTTP